MALVTLNLYTFYFNAKQESSEIYLSVLKFTYLNMRERKQEVENYHSLKLTPASYNE